MKYTSITSAIVFCITIFCITGCQETAKVSSHKTTPKPGDTVFYLGLYLSNDGVTYFSEKDSISQFVCKATSVVKVCVSPSETLVAFAIQDSVQQISDIYSFDIETGKAALLKTTTLDAAINLSWKDDSLLYVSTCEVKAGKTLKQKPGFNGSTELFNAERGISVQKVKPVKGFFLEAAIQDKYFIFSDADGVYIIDRIKSKLLRTLKNFSFNNLNDLQFSYDGSMMLYLRPKTVNDQLGGSHARNELFIANFDGTKEQKLIDFNYDPRHASWSPVANILTCDVINQDWGNLRNAALYNVSVGKVAYNTEEENGFVPNLSTCVWSPIGTQYIVGKKVVNQFFKKENFILHDLESGKGITLKDSTSQEADAAVIGNFSGWFSENLLGFQLNNKFTVYNISAKRYTPFPQGRNIFYLKERL